MDQHVCYIIGQNGSHLYGIACNNRAYMRQKYPNGAWYGIEKEVWETAKTNSGNISSNLVKIEDSYSHSGDPQSDKIKNSSIQWGGTYCKEVNGSFPVIMVKVKVTTSPYHPRQCWIHHFHIDLYTLRITVIPREIEEIGYGLENIGRDVCVGGRVKGGGGGGSKVYVIMVDGWK